jgi:hypothetical protein
MFYLASFAGAGRQVRHRYLQTGLVGEALRPLSPNPIRLFLGGP